MGNIGSQISHHGIQKETRGDREWAHSFPRTHSSKLQQENKVLPERDSRQKLRTTYNGEILQSGGTLRQQHRILNADASNLEFKENASIPRSHVSNQRYSFHKLGYRSNYNLYNKNNDISGSQKSLQEQMHMFGSVPDLRFEADVQEMAEIKPKKKYRAPPPPNMQMNDKSEWEENSDDNEPIKKARLFKTHAETKKHLNHFNKIGVQDIGQSESPVDLRIHSFDHQNYKPNRMSLPEIKLADNSLFKNELKLATKKVRDIQLTNPINTTDYNFINKPTDYSLSTTRSTADGKEKEKLKTLDPSKDNLRKKIKQIMDLMETEDESNIISITTHIRGEPSGKESSIADISPNSILKEAACLGTEKPKPFYFGMNHSVVNVPFIHQNIVEHISKIQHSSESEISSDIDCTDDHEALNSHTIDLQLRPILPKKLLEIPRFSPAAAWKLLSSMENDPCSGTIASDDLPVLVEERIEKYARPPPPNVQIGPRSNNDKSGDSGISGDAGPAAYDENTDAVLLVTNDIQEPPFFTPKQTISWTPQQDLEDDSSLEELNLETSAEKSRLSEPAKNKPHVFSLSLPRDNHLASYMIEKTYSQYSGLQKLKRSVSGVFNHLSHSKKDLTQSNANQEDGNNWFFSKSAPNSINNGFNSLELKSTQEIGGNSKSSARVMYLPERSNAHMDVKEKNENKCKLSVYSKYHEDLSRDDIKAPETLQDPPRSSDLEYKWKLTKKPKKFTFQSTVRQIERRRMAEKLSKEAEKKEKQRLRELEAMQRVEEEFQKKRAREKASIRHQLRLYCMDDGTTWESLPPNLDKNDERPEPDGAFSSSSSSPLLPKSQQPFQRTLRTPEARVSNPPVTQELSEFRQAQIDYKDYRSGARYSPDGRIQRQTTVYPQITRNIPKAKGVTGGIDNYRKDYAYGGKVPKSPGSTHSDESMNNSSTVYHNKYAPMTRF